MIHQKSGGSCRVSQKILKCLLYVLRGLCWKKMSLEDILGGSCRVSRRHFRNKDLSWRIGFACTQNTEASGTNDFAPLFSGNLLVQINSLFYSSLSGPFSSAPTHTHTRLYWVFYPNKVFIGSFIPRLYWDEHTHTHVFLDWVFYPNILD